MANATDFDRSLEKLRNLIKDIDFCMLTTLDDDGCLRSRPMSVKGKLDRERQN
jgi:general stress protein 26